MFYLYHQAVSVLVYEYIQDVEIKIRELILEDIGLNEDKNMVSFAINFINQFL